MSNYTTTVKLSYVKDDNYLGGCPATTLSRVLINGFSNEDQTTPLFRVSAGRMRLDDLLKNRANGIIECVSSFGINKEWASLAETALGFHPQDIYSVMAKTPNPFSGSEDSDAAVAIIRRINDQFQLGLSAVEMESLQVDVIMIEGVIINKQHPLSALVSFDDILEDVCLAVPDDDYHNPILVMIDPIPLQHYSEEVQSFLEGFTLKPAKDYVDDWESLTRHLISLGFHYSRPRPILSSTDSSVPQTDKSTIPRPWLCKYYLPPGMELESELH